MPLVCWSDLSVCPYYYVYFGDWGRRVCLAMIITKDKCEGNDGLKVG